MIFQLWSPTKTAQVTVPSTGLSSFSFFDWWNKLFNLLKATLGSGYTGTVALAKLTSGGANGSMTLVNGVVTSYTAPT